MSGKKRSPVSLQVALEQLLDRLGVGDRVREYEAVTAWSDVVGEKIAGVTRAVGIRRGQLFIEVHSSPWRQELSLRKGEIIEKLNSHLGRAVVKEIQFV